MKMRQLSPLYEGSAVKDQFPEFETNLFEANTLFLLRQVTLHFEGQSGIVAVVTFLIPYYGGLRGKSWRETERGKIERLEERKY